MTSELPLLRALMEGIEGMVFIMRVGEDSDFYYEFLNHAAYEETGLTRNVLGKSIDQVYDEEKANFLYSHYNNVLKSLESLTYECCYESSERKRYYTETKLTPLMDSVMNCTHIVAHVQDITDYKEAWHNKRRFKFIEEHIQGLITVLDEKGRIIYASPSYLDVLGFDCEEFLGKMFHYNVHPEEITVMEAALTQSLKTKEPWNLQVKHKHKEKGWIWLKQHGSPVFDDKGRLAHTVILSTDISLQKEYEMKLKNLAYFDYLTGLPNRRYLYKQLSKTLEDFQQNQSGIGILAMDIDNFKEINDNFGHDIGDEVIVEFGKRISEHIRNVDMVARLGGDEFVALISNIDSQAKAIAITKMIQKAIEKPWHLSDYVLQVTISVGIAFVLPPNPDVTIFSLLKNADEALYEAKKSGKNTYRIRLL